MLPMLSGSIVNSPAVSAFFCRVGLQVNVAYPLSCVRVAGFFLHELLQVQNVKSTRQGLDSHNRCEFRPCLHRFLRLGGDLLFRKRMFVLCPLCSI